MTIALLVGSLVGVASVATAGESPSDTVAMVEGTAISRAELEGRAAAELARLDRERYEVLAAALQELVADRLLESEASRHGVSVEQLLDSGVGSGGTVGAEEVEAFYRANRAHIRQPLEAVRKAIRAHLEEQRGREERARLVADLGAEHPVEVLLEPFRLPMTAAVAPRLGAASAPVEVVEFSDFQCPYCRSLEPELQEVRRRFPEAVSLVYRQLPLTAIHPHAQRAAEASLCADAQGGFWQMHDALFARQSELGKLDYASLGTELGLDGARLGACLENGESREQVGRDAGEARRLGIQSTPTVLVNGRPVPLRRGRPPADQIGEVVEDELARKATE